MSPRAPVLVGVLAALVPALAAGCSGDDGLARPSGRLVEAVSGDGQWGRVGQDLSAPLVVRVTDPRGRALPGIPVRWTVSGGEGAFPNGFEEVLCPPSPSTTTYTDENGRASTAFIPTRFGSTTVAADVWGLQGPPATFTIDARDPGAVLTVVAGNDQEGRAGEVFPELLWVQVTDGQGEPVGFVEVTFAVVAGGGRITGVCHRLGSSRAWRVTRTRPEGYPIDDGGDEAEYGHGFAPIRFAPGSQGPITVAAAVAGIHFSPVYFTLHGHGAVIHLYYDWWGTGDAYFEAPDGSAHATVSLDAAVEWAAYAPSRITSTSVPDEGEPFDSGELDAGDRFAFVPGVAGTWEFVDLVSGAIGSFTAR